MAFCILSRWFRFLPESNHSEWFKYLFAKAEKFESLIHWFQEHWVQSGWEKSHLKSIYFKWGSILLKIKLAYKNDCRVVCMYVCSKFPSSKWHTLHNTQNNIYTNIQKVFSSWAVMQSFLSLLVLFPIFHEKAPASVAKSFSHLEGLNTGWLIFG